MHDEPLGAAIRAVDHSGVATVRAIGTRLSRARAGLLAAAVSYYIAVSLLPILALAAGVVGMVSRGRNGFVDDVVNRLGVEGDAATLVAKSIEHAERVRIASSAAGLIGLIWAGLALTGALRRAVDTVWELPDVGWSARLRTAPWAVVAGCLAMASIGLSSAAAFTGPAAAITGSLAGIAVTGALALWFVGRLGSRRPARRALVIGATLLTLGLELVKLGTIHLVPRLVSRDSALYGALGSVLAALVVFLAIAWLLLCASAVAAELTGPGETGAPL